MSPGDRAARAAAHGPLGSPAADKPEANDPELVRRQALLLVGGLFLVLVCVLVFGVVAEVVRTPAVDPLDAWATPFLHRLASPGLDALMNAASFVGSDLVIVPIALAIGAALAWSRHLREGLFVVAALAGSLVVDYLMKEFFHRARPGVSWAPALQDYSFPSGHSMGSLALGLALAVIVWRLAGPRAGAVALALAVVGALVIGTSRVYLGYHFVTDVVGGFAAAILWVAVLVGVFRTGVR